MDIVKGRLNVTFKIFREANTSKVHRWGMELFIPGIYRGWQNSQRFADEKSAERAAKRAAKKFVKSLNGLGFDAKYIGKRRPKKGEKDDDDG